MNRHMMIVLAGAALGLLLSGTPAAAQGRGQGSFGVDFCKPFVATCPAEVPPLGVCVSILNVCINPSASAGNFEECCEKCNAGSELCGLDPVATCGVNFGCPEE